MLMRDNLGQNLSQIALSSGNVRSSGFDTGMSLISSLFLAYILLSRARREQLVSLGMAPLSDIKRAPRMSIAHLDVSGLSRMVRSLIDQGYGILISISFGFRGFCRLRIGCARFYPLSLSSPGWPQLLGKYWRQGGLRHSVTGYRAITTSSRCYSIFKLCLMDFIQSGLVNPEMSG